MAKETTLLLAHYYAPEEVKAIADYVGDSLDLALKAVEEQPKRIVFAGVRFMAETAKILNPAAEVILPDAGSTCSLVEQTEVEALRAWLAHGRKYYADRGQEVVHLAYINSSAEHKALADMIVTSRIVDDVAAEMNRQGKVIFFSPDRNMGEYLKFQYGYDMRVWSAVCEVHDKFKIFELEKAMKEWTDGPKYVLAHPESPLPVLQKADYVGSTHGMLNYIKEFPRDVGTFFVATEEGLLHDMRRARPELDIRQAPIYSGCQCNQCPYMRKNTSLAVENAMRGIDITSSRIDYLAPRLMEQARRPIERMLEFARRMR